jgi:bacteriorhodopsin
MDINVSDIFLFGIGVFSLSSLYFFFMQKKLFNSAFLVSIVTLASYIVMYSGSYTEFTSDLEPIYPTRWVFYAISCGLLAFEMTRVLKFKKDKMAELLFLTPLVMITGYLSTQLPEESRNMMFSLSSAIYFILAFQLIRESFKQRMEKQIGLYIILGWSMFPVVFGASSAMFGILDQEPTQALYLFLDIFTKIVFYFTLATVVKKGVSEKK